MCRVKSFDFQKVFIFLWVFVFIIFILSGMINNSNYKSILFSNASFIVPNRVAENTNRTEGDDFVFLYSGDYLVLGVGPDCQKVDDDVLEHFNISYEDLEKVKTITYEDELTKLISFKSGVTVYSGKTDKPSYDEYFIQFRSDDREEIVLVYRKDNKTVIEMIMAPSGDISKKEIVKMHGNMGYYSK